MTTYALFIATDPDPVSESDWEHLDQVFDRARLSSGGTIVKVRATESTGHAAADFDIAIATFVNGHQLEVVDDRPESISWEIDGEIVGTASLEGEQWRLVHAGNPEATATLSASDHSHDEVRVRLGKVVEDWLT